MTDRTRKADLLRAAAAVGFPALAALLATATGTAFRPDIAGVVISVVVLVAAIATGYAALRRYRRAE
ncbi:hypothetical protein ACFWPH_28655 [Nocardia sp. NPDC058499]|uniref:hypothetical protein n=1 Tax=Nocardia sp. NPDC058499 TaxID=3346530 RepID=UPI003669B7E4